MVAAAVQSDASGLHMIHEYRSTRSSIKASNGNPGMEDDDHLYGRYGDIKAANILWSVEEILDDSQCSNEGALLMADFGLMDSTIDSLNPKFAWTESLDLQLTNLPKQHYMRRPLTLATSGV